MKEPDARCKPKNQNFPKFLTFCIYFLFLSPQYNEPAHNPQATVENQLMQANLQPGLDIERDFGNCKPWSEHVYLKLFLDPDGVKASLLLVKIELSYTNLFDDSNHKLYRARFIGGKNEGEQWVFDLMKAQCGVC